LVDDPRAGYAITLKPLIYVDARDEDAITLDKALISEPIFSLSQVAITFVYRYQPRAGAPIDAGVVVADNGEIGDYRY
jgi:hypothetical protein